MTDVSNRLAGKCTTIQSYPTLILEVNVCVLNRNVWTKTCIERLYFYDSIGMATLRMTKLTGHNRIDILRFFTLFGDRNWVNDISIGSLFIFMLFDQCVKFVDVWWNTTARSTGLFW